VSNIDRSKELKVKIMKILSNAKTTISTQIVKDIHQLNTNMINTYKENYLEVKDRKIKARSFRSNKLSIIVYSPNLTKAILIALRIGSKPINLINTTDHLNSSTFSFNTRALDLDASIVTNILSVSINIEPAIKIN